MTGLLLFGAGFVVGWVVFERPQLATDFISATKTKIKEIVGG